jgi:hypothetical protein
MTRTCAADDCNERFETGDTRVRYHSQRCSDRVRKRRLRSRLKFAVEGVSLQTVTRSIAVPGPTFFVYGSKRYTVVDL